MESGDLANERQRIAGSGDGVLARLCCRVVTEMIDGSIPSRLAEVLQRGVVAAQSANIGSRFLTMCDFSQCVAHWQLARFGWTAMVTRIATITETVASNTIAV